MGLPDSGLGGSYRRSASELSSKGIRKSSRKSAHPSSALKKLRFGEELPVMQPAPEATCARKRVDPSISPSKGNVSNLVKCFEEGQMSTSTNLDSFSPHALLNIPIAQFPVTFSSFSGLDNLNDAVLTQSSSENENSKMPQFIFGQEKSSIPAVARDEDNNSRNKEMVTCDDTAVERLIPVVDVDKVLMSDCPQLCIDVPSNMICYPLTKSNSNSSLNVCNDTSPHKNCSTFPTPALQPAPSMPITIEQAAFLDFAESQPITASPPLFIPDPRLLPSTQNTLLNPIFYVANSESPHKQLPSPAPATLCLPEDHVDKLVVLDNGSNVMDICEFPPLKVSLMSLLNLNVGMMDSRNLLLRVKLGISSLGRGCSMIFLMLPRLLNCLKALAGQGVLLHLIISLLKILVLLYFVKENRCLNSHIQTLRFLQVNLDWLWLANSLIPSHLPSPSTRHLVTLNLQDLLLGNF